MNVIKTEIDGVVIIEPKVFGDERGYFSNLFLPHVLKRRYVKQPLYRITNRNQAMEY